MKPAVQVVFFVLIAVNHSLDEAGNGLPVLSSASVHALCPFGGVVSIYTYVTADGREIVTDSIRIFAALWSGLPYEAEESSALPNQSLAVLKEEKKISEEEFNSLKVISVRISPAEDTAADGKGEDAVSSEEIVEVLGMEMGSRAMTVRDFLAENGNKFSEYKLQFQELVNAKNAD